MLIVKHNYQYTCIIRDCFGLMCCLAVILLSSVQIHSNPKNVFLYECNIQAFYIEQGDTSSSKQVGIVLVLCAV